MMTAVLWVVAPYRLVLVYQRFRGLYRPLKRWETDTNLHGATTHKTAILKLLLFPLSVLPALISHAIIL
jgi:hypothetical protein